MLYILVAYFIPNSLYLLILYPYISPLPSLSPLVTTSLFCISVSLLLFCYIYLYAFLKKVPVLLSEIRIQNSELN